MTSDRVAILLPLVVAVTMTFSTVIVQALFLMPIIHFIRFELSGVSTTMLFAIVQRLIQTRLNYSRSDDIDEGRRAS